MRRRTQIDPVLFTAGEIPVLMSLESTPYDLRWQMFGIPVRIHPTFWLIALLFSWPIFDRYGFPFLLIGVGSMLVALLAHEMAHALMFALYRVRSSIICYSFGGLTIPQGRVSLRLHRILVTLAGPFTNLALAALLWASNESTPWAITNLYTAVFFDIFFSINLGWGVLNLLPIIPLDGGQVTREIWQHYRPRNATEGSLTLSLVVAFAFSAYAFACHFNLIPRNLTPWWLRPGLFAAILFALLGAQNYMELQNLRRSRSYYDDQSPWR